MENTKPRKRKFEARDKLIVLKDTETYEEGGVVLVLDYDTKSHKENSYLVADLENVGKFQEHNELHHLYSSAKWVMEPNLRSIDMERTEKRDNTKGLLVLLNILIYGSLVCRLLL